MTIDNFDELVSKDNEKREALRAEINDLLQKEAELEAEAQRFADAGDVDSFIEKKNEKDKVSANVYVKRRCLDNLPKLDLRNEAMDTWKDYSGEYNRKMKKAVSDFREEKEKLLKMYSDMVDMQKDALIVRKRLACAIGTIESNLDMEFIPCRSGADVKGSLRLAGFNSPDADACYFLANYCEKNNKHVIPSTKGSDPEERRITGIVMMHDPEIKNW